MQTLHYFFIRQYSLLAGWYVSSVIMGEKVAIAISQIRSSVKLGSLMMNIFVANRVIKIAKLRALCLLENLRRPNNVLMILTLNSANLFMARMY